MKNIFIEGIQGMGKSTLVNSLSKELTQLQVCREGDYSPVELAWCTWMTQEDYNEVLKRYAPIRDEIIQNTVEEGEHFIVKYTRIITDIPNFHKDLEQYEVYQGRKTLQDFKDIIFTRYATYKGTDCLFECSFFQNIIEDLILFYMLEDDEIVEFYRELYENVDKEQFLLVYLYSDRVEDMIQIIRQERCDQSGNEMWYQLMLQYLIHSPYGVKHGYRTFEDMISHFKHRQNLELRIIKEIIGDNVIILPAKEWKIEEILIAFRG